MPRAGKTTSVDDATNATAKGADDLVRFFRALSAEARREIDALAARDRQFGEDVAAERASAPKEGA